MAERPFILAVDDDEMILGLIRDTLSEDYFVRAVPTSLEFVDLIQERRPNLIITDLGIPILDGFELIRSVRRYPSFAEIPILVISAYPNLMSLVPDGLVQRVLPKPFSLDELYTSVSDLLAASPVI